MIEPYYQDNLITLYHGRCEAVMPELEACSFDAVITDIPYGTTACAWDQVIPFDVMWLQIKRLRKKHAGVVLFGSEPFSSTLRCSNLNEFKYDWIWEKSTGTGFLDANSRPLKCHEVMSVFYNQEPTYNPQKVKGPPNHSIKTTGHVASNDKLHRGDYKVTPSNESGDKFPRSVLAFNIVPAAIKLHPTQKPLALMEYLVKTYTNPGDRVLDFTSGSGTTLRACKNLGRHCVGIEMLEHYCAATVDRLAPEFESAWVDEGNSLADLPMFAEISPCT